MKCPSCGNPVWWGTTEARKKMPIDRDPHPDGNVVVAREGTPTLVRVLDKATLEELKRSDPGCDQVLRFVPHFATCTSPPAKRSPAPPVKPDLRVIQGGKA